MFFTGKGSPKRKVAPHSSAAKKSPATTKKKPAQAKAGAKPVKHAGSGGHPREKAEHGHGHEKEHAKKPHTIKAKMAMLPDGPGHPTKPHPKKHDKHPDKHDKKPEKKTCHAHVTVKGRHPSGGRIQVVPEPTQSHVAQLSSTLGKEIKEYKDLMSLRRRAGSFEDFAKAVKKRDGHKPGHDGLDVAFKLEIASWSGGKAELTVETAGTEHCGGEPHTMTLTGPEGAKPLGGGASKIHVRYSGHDPGAGAVPSKYQVHAKESKGHAESLTIECYPSSQLLVMFGVTVKGSIFEKIAKALQKVLKFTGQGEVGFELGGSVTIFEGWREAQDWQAYFATEIAAEFSAKAELSIEVSAAQIFLHVPKAVAKLLPDIVANIGVGGEAGAKGAITNFAFPSSPDRTSGSLELRGKLFVKLGVEAHAGCDIAGVSIRGDVEPTLGAKGQPQIVSGGLDMVCSVGIEACDLKLEIKMKAFIVFHKTKHAKIHLWDSHDLVHDETWHLWKR